MTRETPDYRVATGTTLKHALYDYLRAHGFDIGRVAYVDIDVTTANVYQFVSTEPGKRQYIRYSRLAFVSGDLYDARDQIISDDEWYAEDEDGPLMYVTELGIANPPV